MAHLEAVRKGKAVAFLSRVYFQSLRHNFGLYDIGHLGRERLNEEIAAVAVPHRSPLLAPFNWV